jgi:hypothetical protein
LANSVIDHPICPHMCCAEGPSATSGGRLKVPRLKSAESARQAAKGSSPVRNSQ